ncbi:ABC transporter permease [Methylopila jiangsuensis]|uniref:Sulfate transport system permease protein CysT n=1 Tax=Methylopila jiangsuensis TaxID=586230 RepID=A0A9W6N3A5_9HYPH|nr:sulfate ABC transporter permease subunit CysT [Methylopila jiangsuensis]MDR6286298.1 sulfate transport system permease protein [Methylopila jiangsuensis]GLK76061.1 ABC transporter permease [Methylopila jiangsuensis]
MPHSVLPGFRLALACTLLYLGVIVLLPLAALLWQASGLGFARFVAVVTSERALAAFRITVLCAAGATVFNAVYGLALAWVLARYEFPGKRLLDALVDVPFALPTAVAGVALTALFARNGWYGALLDPLGITVAYTPLGIMAAMSFTSIPFVTRSVQPVLEDLSTEVEEAAETLGAGHWRIFVSVVFPALFPAFLAGCSLAFARSLGEFGAVIFIAGNQPFRTEIAALLTFIRLEEYDYQAAAAIATVMLAAAFLMLLVTNAIQLWSLRHQRAGR